MPVPEHPKIYHIVHVDRLPSIIATGHLYSDQYVSQNNLAGTNIGMTTIKARRLAKSLASHPGLMVGSCVPFYFCFRSVMLFYIHCQNASLGYKGGQNDIVHLEADFQGAIAWANGQGLRWAFTTSNAGSKYFQDRADCARLDDINWDAVAALQWGGSGVDPALKEGKQAEFLVETRFPWTLVSRIGIMQNTALHQRVTQALIPAEYKPPISYQPDWYY